MERQSTAKVETKWGKILWRILRRPPRSGNLARMKPETFKLFDAPGLVFTRAQVIELLPEPTSALERMKPDHVLELTTDEEGEVKVLVVPREKK